jgi:hypothetical protein
MKFGFAVTAVAGRRRKGGEVEILAQKVTYSSHSDRELMLMQHGLSLPNAGDSNVLEYNLVIEDY